MIGRNGPSHESPLSGPRAREPLRTVVARFGGLAGATVVSQLIGFAALAYVARKIGTATIGAFVLAVTITSYAGLIANAGIAMKATRDIARDLSTAEVAVREAITLQCFLGVAVYVLLLALAPLVPNRSARDMLTIVAVMPLLSAVTLDWPLLAVGCAKPVGIWRSIGQIAYAIPIPILIGTGLGGALCYAGLNIFGLAVTACGLLYSYRRLMHHAWQWPRVRALVTRLHDSVPFAAVQVLLVLIGGIGPI